MEEKYESFDKIIDPETNMNVPVESKVGQQVIKNYLECVKNGPDSSNIVSTKMYYKPKKSTTKESNNSSKKSSNKVTKQPDTSRVLKGKCNGKCGTNIYSDNPRVKSGGKYYHEKCFNLLQNN